MANDSVARSIALSALEKAASSNSVSVSATGTATDEVGYITIDGVEKKLAGGGGGSSYTFTDGLTESSGTVSWDLNDKIMRTPYSTTNPNNGGIVIGDNNVSTSGTSYRYLAYAAPNSLAISGTNASQPLPTKALGYIGTGQTTSGSLAVGYMPSPASYSYCYIQAEASGSIAFGATGYASESTIHTRGIGGSLAGGYASGTSISASGNGSVALGYADGSYSNSGHISASGKGSIALGRAVLAQSDGQIAVGKYNTGDSANTYGLILGNGTNGNNRSNAFTVDWQGNGVFAGTVSSSGSDYAEFFEWKDGNPDEEDRIAYIVTLDNGKIKKANENDDILGIISGTTSMTGDDAEWTWHGKFLQDKYGRFIYEDYDVTHEEGTEHEWVEHVHTRKINPDYDPERPYIPRSERPEWSEVGLLGKLFVRDDGTAEVNGYVKASNGIATNSTEKTNMRVLERIDANTIRVLLK